MFPDFELPSNAADVMSSPIPQSIARETIDFDPCRFDAGLGFEFDQFAFSDDIPARCFSQPLPPLDEGGERFAFSLRPPPRPSAPPPAKKKALVLKPFQSFEATELAVKQLRQMIGTRVAFQGT
jgi:hypothetical protein